MDSFKDADSYLGQMAFDYKKNAGKAPKSQAVASYMAQSCQQRLILPTNRCN